MLHRDWPDKGEYLRYVDLLKVDHREARVLTCIDEMEPAIARLRELGAGAVMCTHAGGVVVGDATGIYREDFAPYTLEGRTGRGDTCTATYLVARAERDTAEATRIAAEITSAKMQYRGPLRTS